MQESVDVFKRVIDVNNEEKNRNCMRAGERKVPKPLSNALLENISSNFVFPRPKRDVYAKKNQFPKTQYQEKILYKKPPFTLRNQLKHHVIRQEIVTQAPATLYQPSGPMLQQGNPIPEPARGPAPVQQGQYVAQTAYANQQAYRPQPVATSGTATPRTPYTGPVTQSTGNYQTQGQPGQYTPQTAPARPGQPTAAPQQPVQSNNCLN
jgi:hypothetical protein